MREIKAIIKPERLSEVLDALHQIRDIPGMTVSSVRGYGTRRPGAEGGPVEFGEVMMTKLEVVVPTTMVAEAIERIQRAACTGHAGDGKVFVLPVEQAVKIRSGLHGPAAL